MMLRTICPVEKEKNRSHREAGAVFSVIIDTDHSNQKKANGILRWIWLWSEEVSPD
jgi:hypothetical protein